MPKRKPATTTLPAADSSPVNSTATSTKSPTRKRKTVTQEVNKTRIVQQSESVEEAYKGVASVQLAQIAGVIPAENLQQLAAAVQSGRWLFAVWHVADGRLHLERTATNFPTVDLDKSVAMLTDNLKELSNPS